MKRSYISNCHKRIATKPEAGKDGKGLGKWRCPACGQNCKVEVRIHKEG